MVVQKPFVCQQYCCCWRRHRWVDIFVGVSGHNSIERVGLGVRVLAILAFAANTLCAILIRDRNKAVGAVQLTFDVKNFKRKEFLLL
jgi:hypothetical protein